MEYYLLIMYDVRVDSRPTHIFTENEKKLQCLISSTNKKITTSQCVFLKKKLF